ncbi:MAG: site-specific integrase [Candidatus Shapirobacteria bacterium]
MTLDILPTHLESYTLWLQSHQYQSNTIRNYQQDLKTYFTFSQDNISEEQISKYIQYVSTKNNSARYLASLSLFCQYLLDQHLTDSNVFKQTKKHLLRQPLFSVDKILNQYQDFLSKDNKSHLTIKNYVNDIHQYFEWLDNHDI